VPDEPLCVHCRERPAVDRFRPFCSERCKAADLGHWLSGNYRVPVRQGQDSDTAESAGSGEPREDIDDGS
jgi:endogenous inhibitor of DNA gyrase (YacG/DUF329 family)